MPATARSYGRKAQAGGARRARRALRRAACRRRAGTPLWWRDCGERTPESLLGEIEFRRAPLLGHAPLAAVASEADLHQVDAKRPVDRIRRLAVGAIVETVSRHVGDERRGLLVGFAQESVGDHMAGAHGARPLLHCGCDLRVALEGLALAMPHAILAERGDEI